MDGLSAAQQAELLAPLASLGVEGWVVGGGLRDLLLGRPVADVDVALSGDAGAAAQALARVHRATRFALSAEFGGWRRQRGDAALDGGPHPPCGRLHRGGPRPPRPDVNAMAVSLAGGPIIDPHGGRDDLRRGLLRMVTPEAFQADPVRVLRLVRQAQELGFATDPETRRRSRAAAAGLARVAPERVRAELAAMLTGSGPAGAVRRLAEEDLLTAVLPELAACRGLTQGSGHHLDVLGHTLCVVDGVCGVLAEPARIFADEAGWIADRLRLPLADGLTRADAVVLAALLHDLGKPETRRVRDGRISFEGHELAGAAIARACCERLRFASRLTDLVVKLVAVHGSVRRLAADPSFSLRDVHRLVVAAEPVEVELLVLSACDRAAARGGPDPDGASRSAEALVRHLARCYREMAARTETALLDGNEISSTVGRPPGRWLGRQWPRFEKSRRSDVSPIAMLQWIL